MTQSEFLQELRRALENDLSGSIVRENVEFYNQYIADEVRKGKSEEEVLQMLGDPWVLAKTVIDAQDGTDQSIIYEAGENTYTGYGNRQDTGREGDPRIHLFKVDAWWKKLLWALSIFMIVIAVLAIITGVIRILAPILVPLLIVMIIVRALGGRNR